MAACFAKTMNCDNLWRPWYILIVSCLQVYMLYFGVARYINFKSHYFDPKYGGNWNPEPLNFYLSMLIIAAFFGFLFLYSSLTRGSNLAAEGITLGQEIVVYSPHAGCFPWPPQQAQSQQEGSNAGLYATANGVLDRGNLSVGLGVGGEEEGMPPFDTWSARSAAHVPSSDFGGYPILPTMFRSMISTGGTIMTGGKEGWSSLAIWKRFRRHFIPTSSLMHILSAYAFFLSLPVLEAQQICHYVLPFESVWKSNLNPILQASPPNAMSVEFFNLIFAFAALVHQYPAVFWRTNHCFAFTFSLLLAILGIQGLLEINATEIIVKLCWNDKNSAPFLAGLCRLAPSEMPETAAEKVDFLAPADFDKPAVDPEGLQNAAALFLSTFGTLVMLMLTACVFDYGIDQFVDRLATLRRSTILRPSSQNIVPSDSASIQGDGVGGVCGLKSEGHRIRQRTIVCRRVVAVIGALCVLAIKTPILIACGRTFEIARQPLLLANIVATIVFFCVWFITWFAFCLKPEWKFKITYSSPYHVPVFPQAVNLNSQYLSQAATLVRLGGNNGEGGPTGILLAATVGSGGPGAAMAGDGNCGGGGGGGGVDNGVSGLRMTSGSPLYACLNDGGSAIPNVNPGLCRLAGMAPPPPPPPAGQVSIGQTNRVCSSAQQNVDCCSVDTEGSSRQSGTNNYVCLQSSLNATNPLGMNALPQTQSYSNTNPTNALSFNQQSLGPSNHENTDSDGTQRYAVRPREILSPTSLRFINSSPFAVQGSGEADAGHLLNDNVEDGFLPQSSSSNNASTTARGTPGTSTKVEDSKQTQPRVTFKELSDKMKSLNNTSEHCSLSNPNSSSDSGIDNHGLVPASASTTPATLGASLFATLPTVSRASLSLSFNGTTKGRNTEPTYCNQEQMSSSSNSTPGVFECPSMPPLNLPQNKAGEVSFASLSRRFNLRATSFESPSPLPPTSNEPTTEEGLMNRSVSMRRGERPSTGRLCSQV